LLPKQLKEHGLTKKHLNINNKALENLNSIVHPHTHLAIEKHLSELKQTGASVVVIEAPLLIEVIRNQIHWAQLIHEIWVTDVSENLVIERIQKRNKVGEQSIISRINSQIPREERNKYANVLINNNGTPENLREHVKILWQERVISTKTNSDQQ